MPGTRFKFEKKTTMNYTQNKEYFNFSFFLNNLLFNFLSNKNKLFNFILIKKKN